MNIFFEIAVSLTTIGILAVGVIDITKVMREKPF